VDGQGKGPKGKLPIGWKKLSLTAEQEKAIRKLDADAAAKIADLIKQLADLKQQVRVEQVKLLTDAQKKQLSTLPGDEPKKEQRKSDIPLSIPRTPREPQLRRSLLNPSLEAFGPARPSHLPGPAPSWLRPLPTSYLSGAFLPPIQNKNWPAAALAERTHPDASRFHPGSAGPPSWREAVAAAHARPRPLPGAATPSPAATHNHNHARAVAQRERDGEPAKPA